MLTPWRIEMFGWLRAVQGDRVVGRFESYKTSCLLSFLALKSDTSHPREVLAEMLWPEGERRVILSRLSQALSTLRRQLEPTPAWAGALIQSDARTVRLNPDLAATDVWEFRTRLEEADRAASSNDRIRSLTAACALYRGPLTPTIYEDWALLERECLEQLYFGTLSELKDLYAAQGSHLRADELAVRLRGLEEPFAEPNEISSIAPARAISSKPGSTPQTALPTPHTKFVGRGEELVQIQCALTQERRRIVTLVGAGGCGKTRLALEAGHRMGQALGRHLHFVSLAEFEDPALLLEIVHKCFGPIRGVNVLESLAAIFGLSSEGHLVILDNFEHLLPEAAPILARLLDRIPNLKVLVTSRQHLQLAEEFEIPVEPLPVPEPSFSIDLLTRNACVQLFVDRAQAVHPEFRLTARNADLVARLCIHLEGIPLAVELAAAWASSLTVSQMISRMGRRSSFLVSRRRDVVERHSTLWRTIDYSFSRLSPTLQQTLCGLTVFLGTWSLEAAEAILGSHSVLESLTSLRENSLIDLAPNGGDQDQGFRFRMLESITEFCRERINPEAERTLKQAHAEYFSIHAGSRAAVLKAEQSNDAIRTFEIDTQNVLSALDYWESRRDYERSAKIAIALSHLWEIRGQYKEGIARLAPYMARQSRLEWVLQAEVCMRCGHLNMGMANFSKAEECFRLSLELSRREGDIPRMTDAYTAIGSTKWSRFSLEDAAADFDVALKMSKESGYAKGTIGALKGLGVIAVYRRDFEAAETIYRECLAPDPSELGLRHVATCFNNLGVNAVNWGRFDAAKTYYLQAYESWVALGHQLGSAIALLNLEEANRKGGNLVEARRCTLAALQLFVELENLGDIVACFLATARIRDAEQGWTDVAILVAAYDAWTKRLSGAGHYTNPENASDGETLMRKAGDELGPEKTSALANSGRAKLVPELVQLCTEILSRNDRP